MTKTYKRNYEDYLSNQDIVDSLTNYRKFGKTESTGVEHSQRRGNMARHMRRRGHTRSRRGRRAGRTARRSALGLNRRVTALEHTKEETKHLIYSDFGVTGSMVITNAYNIQKTFPFSAHLNPLIRGVTVQDRLGDKATWTSFNLKLHIYALANIVSQTFVNWALVKNIRQDGLNLIASTYLGDMYGVSQPSIPYMFRDINNHDVKGKYQVLRQGIEIIHGTNDDSTLMRIVPINYRKPVVTSYTLGNNGDYQDIDRNGIYIVVWTDSLIGAGGLAIHLEGQAFFHG